MNTTTDLKMQPFDVYIPNLDGDAIAETVRIEVPVRIDPESGEEILTPEAHELIEKTKARRMGLMLPSEIRDLRERLELTQEEMSELLQTGAKTYTRWESGRARVSRSMNVLLCALRDGRIDVNYLRRLRNPNAEPEWPAKDWARMILAGFRIPVPPVEFQARVAETFAAWLERHDVFEERSIPLLTVRPGARELTAIQRRFSDRGTWIVESQQEFPRTILPNWEESFRLTTSIREVFEEPTECEETLTSKAA
jgi:DNA-binding transcriptional regulator YiaG